MNVLFARYNLELQKLDLGYTHFADLAGFYDYAIAKNWHRAVSESYSARQISEPALLEVLEKENDMIGNWVQMIKGSGALVSTLPTLRRTLTDALAADDRVNLSDFDQQLLAQPDKLLYAAQQRAESDNLETLFAQGAFTLRQAGDDTTDLYFNNALAGTFLPKRVNAQDYHMNPAGDELDMATDEVLQPIKPPGQKYGDELCFFGNDTGAVNFPDHELFHTTPATALTALVRDKDYRIDRHHVRRAGPLVTRELDSLLAH